MLFLNRIKPHSLGLTLGIFLGLLHALWSLLIALGWAQGLLDFIYGLHMIQPSDTVKPFDLGHAIVLVLYATVVGYVIGWLIGVIWNRCGAK